MFPHFLSESLSFMRMHRWEDVARSHFLPLFSEDLLAAWHRHPPCRQRPSCCHENPPARPCVFIRNSFEILEINFFRAVPKFSCESCLCTSCKTYSGVTRLSSKEVAALCKTQGRSSQGVVLFLFILWSTFLFKKMHALSHNVVLGKKSSAKLKLVTSSKVEMKVGNIRNMSFLFLRLCTNSKRCLSSCLLWLNYKRRVS